MILAWIVLAVALIYGIVMIQLTMNWRSIQKGENGYKAEPVTLIVVYRNEQNNLPRLLRSLGQQDCQTEMLELIFVDDDSSDRSVELVNDFLKNVRFQARNESLKATGDIGKKRGIELGVSLANHKYILTTDADCLMDKHWVQSMSSFGMGDFVSGPVCYEERKGVFAKLIQLDLISLSALGGCMIQRDQPNLANGANMLFAKSRFLDVGGYSSNSNIPSGDDVFLLANISQDPRSIISFRKEKEAIVETQMARSFGEFMNQRIRWAGKTRHSAGSRSQRITWILLTSYFAFFLVPIIGLGYRLDYVWLVLASAWLIKYLADLIFFKDILTFFDQKQLMRYVGLAGIVHPFYVVTVAVLSIFLPYKWKSRKIKNG